MCTHTHSLCFVKVSLVLRGLCFPLGGREAPCSQPSLDGTQLCLMLSLSFCFWCSLYWGKIMGAQEAKALSLLSPSRSYCQN